MDDTIPTGDVLAQFSEDTQTRALSHGLALEYVDLSGWLNSGDCAFDEWSEAVDWMVTPIQTAAEEAINA